jgi:hypothetical protein
MVVSQEKFPHDDDGGGCGGEKKKRAPLQSLSRLSSSLSSSVQKKIKKNLSDMYARCKICIMKPENFEETIKNKK